MVLAGPGHLARSLELARPLELAGLRAGVAASLGRRGRLRGRERAERRCTGNRSAGRHGRRRLPDGHRRRWRGRRGILPGRPASLRTVPRLRAVPGGWAVPIRGPVPVGRPVLVRCPVPGGRPVSGLAAVAVLGRVPVRAVLGRVPGRLALAPEVRSPALPSARTLLRRLPLARGRLPRRAPGEPGTGRGRRRRRRGRGASTRVLVRRAARIARREAAIRRGRRRRLPSRQGPRPTAGQRDRLGRSSGVPRRI
jgi:hypothetical protein